MPINLEKNKCIFYIIFLFRFSYNATPLECIGSRGRLESRGCCQTRGREKNHDQRALSHWTATKRILEDGTELTASLILLVGSYQINLITVRRLYETYFAKLGSCYSVVQTYLIALKKGLDTINLI